MIDFNWPWVFLFLPFPLFLIRRQQSANVEAIAIPPALEKQLDALSKSKRLSVSIRQLLIWIAWLCFLCAIAQPWHPGDTQAQPVSGRAISLAVDVSGSMERRDFSLDGIDNDRLSVVKQVAHEFVEQRNGDRVSLVLYGREAFIASPLTFDLTALGSILDSAGIGMAGRSTAIGDAIGLSIQTLQNDPATSKAIILLSDGTNNAGSVEPESAAELATSLGIRIHTIALGSEDKERTGFNTANSADLDEETLKSIAETAQGQFFRATNTEDLKQIYEAIDKLESAEVEAPPVIVKQDLRFWPQLILLVSLLLVVTLQRLHL